MAVSTRLLTFALVAGMMSGTSKAVAEQHNGIDRARRRPEARNTRRTVVRSHRHQTSGPVPSPDGRHTLAVRDGTVMVNGRAVHADAVPVWLLGNPVWRKDGRAVAWMERSDGVLRLVVVPDVSTPDTPLVWALPTASRDDSVSWVGTRRVHVGVVPLAPRAVATWTTEGV